MNDLIDTLGEPEGAEEDTTTYTGPEVLVCDLDMCRDSYLMGRRADSHDVMVMRHKRIPSVMLLGEKQGHVCCIIATKNWCWRWKWFVLW